MIALDDYWANPPAYCTECALYCCKWCCDAHEPDGDGHCKNAVPHSVEPSPLAMRLETMADWAYEKAMYYLIGLADGSIPSKDWRANEYRRLNADFNRKRRVFTRRLQSEYRKQQRREQEGETTK